MLMIVLLAVSCRLHKASITSGGDLQSIFSDAFYWTSAQAMHNVLTTPAAMCMSFSVIMPALQAVSAMALSPWAQYPPRFAVAMRVNKRNARVMVFEVVVGADAGSPFGSSALCAIYWANLLSATYNRQQQNRVAQKSLPFVCTWLCLKCR